jgi:hypothetical protein
MNDVQSPHPDCAPSASEDDAETAPKTIEDTGPMLVDETVLKSVDETFPKSIDAIVPKSIDDAVHESVDSIGTKSFDDVGPKLIEHTVPNVCVDTTQLNVTMSKQVINQAALLTLSRAGKATNKDNGVGRSPSKSVSKKSRASKQSGPRCDQQLMSKISMLESAILGLKESSIHRIAPDRSTECSQCANEIKALHSEITNLTAIVRNNNRVADSTPYKNEISSLRTEISELTTLVNQLLVESRSLKVPDIMVEKTDSTHNTPTTSESTKCEADHSAKDYVPMLEPSAGRSPTSSAQLPGPEPPPPKSPTPKNVPTSGDTTKVLNIANSDVITVDNSKFQGFCALVHSVEEISSVIKSVKSSPKSSVATHNIVAYRLSYPNGDDPQESCIDDGEDKAGGKLLRFLQDLHLTDLVVVISRWYGGKI